MKKKTIITLIIGLITGLSLSGIGTYAATTYAINANKISYSDNSNLGVDNVQAAIDGTCIKFSEQLKDMRKSMYPVGSIYFSATLSTIDQVKDLLGGEGEVYGKGKTLVGVDENDDNFNKLNKTGGNSTITLAKANLPSHDHSIPALKGTTAATGSGYSIGYTSATRTTSTNGEHSHNASTVGIVPKLNQSNTWFYNFYLRDFWNNIVTYTNASDSRMYDSYGLGYILTDTNGNHTHTVSDYYANSISGVENHSHSVTTTASTTGTTGTGTAFSVQNPYITVYMYKRIK